MKQRVAIVGAGVSGLTCGIVVAECGYRSAIFAQDIGQRTTSGAAGAIWFPYDAEPVDKVIAWALETYQALVDLSRDSQTGASMLELRSFSRTGEIPIPDWATPLGTRPLSPSVLSSEYASPARTEASLTICPSVFKSGFTLNVPLMYSTIYLDYLANRFQKAGGTINGNVRFKKLEDVGREFDLVINCSGIGAKTFVADVDLESHRGQVAIVPKIENLSGAIVCDDFPLMYAIPRTHDCVFGGTNELSDNLTVDPAITATIVVECSRVLSIDNPRVVAERVGLRPFRKSGVRLETEKLRVGRVVIHNYGHGGSGFTLSWGCAANVFQFAQSANKCRKV